jgi:hypothetical protein
MLIFASTKDSLKDSFFKEDKSFLCCNEASANYCGGGSLDQLLFGHLKKWNCGYLPS